MRKVLLVLALSMMNQVAHAETVRLSMTDSIQEGIRFKNLGKCLFISSGEEAAEASVIDLELKPDDFGGAQGKWKKEVTVGFKKVEYRVTATRAAGPGAELRVNAQILVDGTVENETPVSLDDSLTNAAGTELDAVVAHDDANCYSANLGVAKSPFQDLQLSMSESAAK